MFNLTSPCCEATFTPSMLRNFHICDQCHIPSPIELLTPPCGCRPDGMNLQDRIPDRTILCTICYAKWAPNGMLLAMSLKWAEDEGINVPDPLSYHPYRRSALVDL